MRQHDVEADGLPARLVRASVAGLHHAGAAAGDDDILAPIGFETAFGHDLREAAGLVIVVREVGQGLGAGGVAVFGRGDAGAAEHDDGGFDAAFVHHQLGLEEFKLEADGAEFLTRHEIAVGEGQAVGGGAGLGGIGDALDGLHILDAVAEGMGAGFVFHGTLKELRGVGPRLIGSGP